MKTAYHRRVKRHGRNTCVYKSGAAVYCRKTRTAPRAWRCVAEKRHRNGGNRVKSESYQKRRGNGCGRTGARGSL